MSIPPPVHSSGAIAPQLTKVPGHVAVVMDGNGRWANARGLLREIEGYKVGEETLMGVVAGAIEVGVQELSAYAFSTENWKRSPPKSIHHGSSRAKCFANNATISTPGASKCAG